MDEQAKKLVLQLMRRANKFWRIGVLLIVLCGSCTYISTWFIAERFTSTETISLQDEETFNALLKNVVAPVNTKNNFSSAKSIITTSTVLERVALSVELLDSLSTQSEKIAILSFLSKNMSIKQEGGKSSIITISFTAYDPKMAHAIVTKLSREFIHETLSTRQKTAKLALDFLSKQRIKTAQLLEQEKQKLKEYKQNNFYSLPGQNLDGSKNIFEIKKSLIESKTRLSEITKRISLLRETLTQYRPQKAELNKRLTDLTTKITTYSKIYTTHHPKMRQWYSEKNRLELTRALPDTGPSVQLPAVDAALALNKKGLPSLNINALNGGDIFTISRIMQEQELTLEREMLLVRSNEYSSILKNLRVNIEQIPLIEKNISEMKNTISLYQKNFTELNKKYMDAQHSIDIAILDANAGYSILTPAVIPLWAHYPHKQNFLFGGMLAGLCIFIMTLILIEMIHGRILDREDVEDILECRYLGTIPHITQE